MRATSDDATASHHVNVNANLADRAHALFAEQARDWPLLADNLAALKSVRTRSIPVDDFILKVQFTPARIASTGAKLDPKTTREKKCFLCAKTLPPVQRGLPFGDHYTVLCNPFPIMPEH